MGLRKRKKDIDQMVREHEEAIARQREALERQAQEQRLARGARQQPGGSRPPVRPPGWYPDEHRPGHVRWWNGSAWTDNVRPA